MASNSTPTSPIVFKARGMKPDVCLEVFGTEFHVHLVVLKLHSHFFYTFFDSADKSSTGVGGAFKYEWVTKVVDDGMDWQLVCKGQNAGDLALDTYVFDKEYQTTAFSKLMLAFYNQIFSLESCNQLATMTSLAHFYMALPVLSNSLSTALLHKDSSYMVESIMCNAAKMISVAAELRHQVLFRDAVVLAVGYWGVDIDELCSQLKNRKICKLVRNTHNALWAQIGRFQTTLLKLDFPDIPWQEMKDIAGRSWAMFQIDEHGYDGRSLCLPLYYHNLYKIEASDEHLTGLLRAHIEPLLVNELILPFSEQRAEVWRYHYFLCITIEDDDLPWDTTETDW